MLRPLLFLVGIILILSGCSYKGVNLGSTTSFNSVDILERLSSPRVKLYSQEQVSKVQMDIDKLNTLISLKKFNEAKLLKQKIELDTELIVLESEVMELREQKSKYKSELDEFEGADDYVFDELEELMKDDS
jgi:septal ring factor EnvC (AmiA/AmiB activator)